MELQHEIEQFLYRQSELLDTKQWQAWIDLFADDGVYWMPADPAHKHWDGVPSIFAEDKNLMNVRMKRVLHPDAWSQRPLWGTNHVVSNVILEKTSVPGEIIVRSRFHMMELRRDDVRHFGRDIQMGDRVETAANCGTSEAPMRNQMKAWARYMAAQ